MEMIDNIILHYLKYLRHPLLYFIIQNPTHLLPQLSFSCWQPNF